jgi:hypothetical protein
MKALSSAAMLVRNLHNQAMKAAATLLAAAFVLSAQHAEKKRFTAGSLVVSRVNYDGNTFGEPTGFPDIFAAKGVSGVQASVHLDEFSTTAGAPRLKTLLLHGVTSNFAGRLEGVLMQSVDGHYLTYIGEAAPVGSTGTSTSYNTGLGVNLQGNAATLYNRLVAMIGADGTVTLNPVNNAYSGDVPRAAITIDGSQFYMVGNSDATIYDDGTGPGTSIGLRYLSIGADVSVMVSNYFASDRPDETAANHVKDNNWCGIAIYKGKIYVAKGSGGNGDNGVFVVSGADTTASGNTITQLFGSPATDPVSKAASIHTPYGFWFANDTTLYVADEGNISTDPKTGALIPDPLAGLQKWIVGGDGKWTLAYTLQSGLNIGTLETVAGYPVQTTTYGLRNLTGQWNADGTATIYAVSGQYSSMSSGTPDPNKLVAITDTISATTLPASEQFTVLQVAPAGQAFRGVAWAPVK